MTIASGKSAGGRLDGANTPVPARGSPDRVAPGVIGPLTRSPTPCPTPDAALPRSRRARRQVGRRTAGAHFSQPALVAQVRCHECASTVDAPLPGTRRYPAVIAAVTRAIAPAISRLIRTPESKPPGRASRAPKIATARAPPSWRLVLRTPLAVPACSRPTVLRARRSARNFAPAGWFRFW